MKILHVAALSMNMAAGPTYSVPSFMRAQNTIDGITSDLLISTTVDKQNYEFFYRDNYKNKKLYTDFLSSYDLVVFHSTYIIEHVKIANILKSKSIPYIIVPRGGFTKGAKEIKKWKKKIGDILIFNDFFNSANAIHFLTDKEKEESVHKTNKDFILPNGITIPNITQKSRNNNIIKMVYIGRIDIYHKGLDLLIQAIGLIKDELRRENAIIDLYGPDVQIQRKN